MDTYGKYVRHLNARVGEPIGISTSIRKKAKSESSAFSDHLRNCSHLSPSNDFSKLNRAKPKFLLEWKESILMISEKQPERIT